jgi:hypothetical protein
MLHIGKFLKKFQQVGRAPRQVAKTLSECARMAGIPIPESAVIYRSGTAFVNAPSVIKTEIFIKKSQLLEELSRKLPEVRVEDIR